MNIKKRGSSWLTEETARIILALVVISFLIILVVKLASIFQGKNDYERAKTIVEELSSLINNIDTDPAKINNEVTFLIEGPKDWTLTSSYDERSLCLCPDFQSGKIDPATSLECSKKGACIQTKKQFIVEPTSQTERIILSKVPQNVYLAYNAQTQTVYITTEESLQENKLQ